MKKYLVLLIMLCARSAFSQVNDNFNDGNFSSSPEWKGDLAAFSVNSAKQLQTVQNTAAQTFSLATANSLAINTKWEFFLQLNFDPSANNQVRIYLTSDNENLKGSLNGYFILIGETGSTDSYDLYRQSGTSITRIIDGPSKTRLSAGQLIARIQVTRTAGSLWELKTDVTGGTAFSSEGIFTDNTYTSSAWSGIHCKYTTTNSDKFIFDDFKIEELVTDNLPPKLLSAIVIDSLTIDALFDEPMDSISVKVVRNFSLNNNYGSPSAVSTTGDASKFRLKFTKALITGNYLLTAQNVSDRKNNIISAGNTASFSYIRPYFPARYDLVINEIFADPSPQIDLPSVEFIELFNTTDHSISLQGWKYADASTTISLPNDSIGSGKYVILSARSDTAEFKRYGRVIGVSPWPSLNNSGDILKLVSPENKVIDSVAYADSWYRDASKKQGGWTLERVDPRCTCQGLFNWKASIDSTGGTPGRVNSVYVAGYDKIDLEADSVKQLSDSTLRVFFNKHLNSATVSANKFSLFPADSEISSLHIDSEHLEITLTYASRFKQGTDYRLTASGISDCSGNSINTNKQHLTFKPASVTVTPPTPLRTDTARIFFTEIFADPSPEVKLPLSEFLEIYNPGRDTVDLDGWTINDPGTKTTIRKTRIPPKEFLILCPAADTLQYQSFGKVAGLSPWPSLNNTSDQIVLKSFSKRIADSVSYADTWYKNSFKKNGGWTLERIDPFSVCRGIFNWVASADSSGGTPGKQNSVYIADYDKIPFHADSLKLLSDSTIRIFFNKYPDTSTVRADLFKVNSQTLTSGSVKFESDYLKATLTFKQRLSPGTVNTFSVSGISDCRGNVITIQSFNFLTPSSTISPALSSRADTANLYITEIFADPSPEVRLPLSEFVEIFNPGKDTIDLDGWTLNDTGTRAIIKKAKILPKEFLILCPAQDTIQYKPIGKTIGISPWPSLNNASDQIVLKSFKSRLVDSVAYSDSWYKNSIKKAGGWTLEKLEPQLPNNFYSWTACENSSGGTPGSANSTAISNYHKQTLHIDSVAITSDSTLRISLNMVPDTAYVKASYFNLNLIGKAKEAKLTSSYRQIDLKFSDHFKEDVSYLLTIDSLRMISGTMIDPLSNQSSFIRPGIPEQDYKVIITEIFADPSPQIGLPDGEFIELFNTSKNAVNLKGMSYEDATGTKHIFKTGSVEPGEYLIICAEKDTLNYQPFGKVLGISTWPSLNNDKDLLILRNNKGKEFHRVLYNNTWYKDKEKLQGGWTLELIDPETVCSGSQNWMASTQASGGTPGKQNSVYKMYNTNVPLKMTDAVLLDSVTVRLNFNRPVDSLSASARQNYSLNNGLNNPASALPLAPDFDQVVLKFSSNLTRGALYKIIAANITDCAGVTISQNAGSAEFLYPEKIAKNDIIINEILFNPRPGGSDFVEIYNKTDKAFDLKDLSLCTINNKDSIISIKQISAVQRIIAPRSYLALTTDPQNIKKEYISSDPGALFKMASLPGYNNDEGVVILLSDGMRIDQLNYSEKMHFGLIKDPEGVSLERSSFNAATNEDGNFRSAAASSGYATPGYKNSQYADNMAAGKEEAVLTSKTFSPDNDGFEDVLTLNYNFSRAGMIANAAVYNDKGILIKKLSRNTSLAQKGTITWDGLTETNELCPVGIYIMYLEVFNLDGTVRKYRKNCVLASKLN